MIPEGSMYRVEALRNFGVVKKGDVGGLVENECNLSHYGTCWVYDDAMVYGNAQIYDDARVYGNAKVYGNAMIFGNAEVCDNAQVYGRARVYGSARVGDCAKVYGTAAVFDKAKVYGDVQIYDSVRVYDKAVVSGSSIVHGAAEIGDCAKICSEADYIVFKNWWSSGRYFTWTRSNNLWKVGCFFGSGEELIKKAYSDSEDKGKEYERIVRYVESINVP